MQEKNTNDLYREALLVFARVSGWIGVPVVLALFVGKYLDAKYSIAPWGTLSAVGISFMFSLFGIIRETTAYMKRMAQETQQK